MQNIKVSSKKWSVLWLKIFCLFLKNIHPLFISVLWSTGIPCSPALLAPRTPESYSSWCCTFYWPAASWNVCAACGRFWPPRWPCAAESSVCSHRWWWPLCRRAFSYPVDRWARWRRTVCATVGSDTPRRWRWARRTRSQVEGRGLTVDWGDCHRIGTVVVGWRQEAVGVLLEIRQMWICRIWWRDVWSVWAWLERRERPRIIYD